MSRIRVIGGMTTIQPTATRFNTILQIPSNYNRVAHMEEGGKFFPILLVAGGRFTRLSWYLSKESL
jgi:hypothetical protein